MKNCELYQDKLYKNEIYWTEKGENFVKLCFAFSPELHEKLEPLNFIYAKIAEKIKTENYKIFAVHKNKNKIKVTPLKNFLEIDSQISILIPTEQEIKEVAIEKLLNDKKFNYDRIYRSYYSSELHDIQECLPSAIIISHCLSIHCANFISCPIKNVELFNISAYSVDLYGNTVQNITWDI